LSRPEIRIEFEEPMMHRHCTTTSSFDRFLFLHGALRNRNLDKIIDASWQSKPMPGH
jgi:hypothetical protein